MSTPNELALQAEIQQLRARIAELESERQAAAQQAEEQNRKLLAALEEEKDRLSAVVASISDEVWFADVHKRFTLANPSALREFNLAGGDEIGVENLAASLEVYRPDGSPRPIEDAPPLRALHGESIRNEEEIIRTPGSGQLRYRQVSSSPVKDASGNTIGSVSVVRDITDRKRAEESLDSQREWFRVMLQSIGDAVLATDGAGKIVFFNPVAARLTGWTEEEAAGRTAQEVFQVINEQTREKAEDIILRVLREARVVALANHTALMTRDGREIPVEDSAAPIRDAAGNVVGAVLVFRDVTEKRHAQERIQESEAVLRSFFDSAGMLRGIVELIEGSIVHVSCNRAAAEMFGIAAESIAGKTAAEAGASEEVARKWTALYEESRRTGRPVGREYARRDAQGKERWLLATASYLGPGPRGNPLFAYTVLDISDRKRGEEALRESEDRFRTLANAIPQLCWMANADGWIFWYNQRWYDYTGATPEQMEGWGWQAVHDPQALPAVLERWKASIATGAPFEMVFPLRGPGGAFRPFLTRVMPVRDRQGRVARWFGTNTDISEQRRAEETLKRQAELLKLSYDAMIVWKLDSVIESWNTGAERLYGFREAEALGRITHELLATVFPKPWDEIRNDLCASGSWEGELRHHACDGHEVVVSSRHQLIRGDDGVDRVLEINRDITERKRAEEALGRSERLYRGIGESIDYGVWVCAPDGRNTYASESFLKLVGLTQEQCSNFGWGEVLHPDDAERTIAAWKECVRTEGRWEIEHRFRGVDGKWHPILARGVPVRDEHGQIVCWAGINLDISALKRAEEETRRSNAVLEAFFATSPGILNIVDEESRYLKTDRLTPTYFGLTRETIVGKTVAQLAPDFMREFGPMLREVMETGEPRLNMEVRSPVPDRSGEMAYWIASYFPLALPEGKRGIGIVGVEVTEVKKAEERFWQAQKLESLGLLAGGVAHDFNNLLVGVIGNASLALEMLPAGHPATELVQGVMKTGEQAAHLTRQMLAYSGKGRFLMEALDISAVVRDISGLVRPSISKKIALHLDLEHELPPIEADRGQLQQVLMNLAINAAEAIGSHDGLIAIRTGVEIVDRGYLRLHPEAAELRPGEYVVLEVRDTGCGVDEGVKARIFDPFFSTKFTGRGLGLAAVAGIVRGHKGAIVVSSAPGKGSSFTVLFPPAARPAEQRPTVAPSAVPGSGVVLVVDDERVVREMAKKALERHGYTVLAADGAVAAIDIFKRHPGDIALVVLDLSMPGMTGEEALPELRKIRPEVKVLVSSGYSEAEAMTLFQGQRVSGFIQKPYTSAILAEKVRLALA